MDQCQAIYEDLNIFCTLPVGHIDLEGNPSNHENHIYDAPNVMSWENVLPVTIQDLVNGKWDSYVWSGTIRNYHRHGPNIYTVKPAPLPEGGDNVWISDLDSSGSDKPDLYEIPVTNWGDYCGSGLARSNHRSLIRDFPNIFITMNSGHNGNSLLIRADHTKYADDIFAIGDILKNEYPIYDEEDYSFLEMELAEEAWDAYLKFDLQSDLLRKNIDTDRINEDSLKERFYLLVSQGDKYPYLESADSIVFPGYGDIVEELTTYYRRLIHCYVRHPELVN